MQEGKEESTLLNSGKMAENIERKGKAKNGKGNKHIEKIIVSVSSSGV